MTDNNQIFSEELVARGQDKTEPVPQQGIKEITKISQLLTTDEESFVDAYLRHNLNGVKAMLELRPDLEYGSASTRSSFMLGNPNVRRALQKRLAKDEVQEASLIQKAFAAELPEKISYKELHSFVRTSLEMKGKIGQHKTDQDVKIGLVINNN